MMSLIELCFYRLSDIRYVYNLDTSLDLLDLLVVTIVVTIVTLTISEAIMITSSVSKNYRRLSRYTKQYYNVIQQTQ